MRVMPFHLAAIHAKPRRELWRETFFFLASFAATICGSMILLDHAAAVIA